MFTHFLNYFFSRLTHILKNRISSYQRFKICCRIHYNNPTDMNEVRLVSRMSVYEVMNNKNSTWWPLFIGRRDSLGSPLVAARPPRPSPRRRSHAGHPRHCLLLAGHWSVAVFIFNKYNMQSIWPPRHVWFLLCQLLALQRTRYRLKLKKSTTEHVPKAGVSKMFSK